MILGGVLGNIQAQGSIPAMIQRRTYSLKLIVSPSSRIMMRYTWIVNCFQICGIS